MKNLKKQILGTTALLLLFVGLTNAAQSVDPLSQNTVSKQDIKEFSAPSSTGGDPR